MRKIITALFLAILTALLLPGPTASATPGPQGPVTESSAHFQACDGTGHCIHQDVSWQSQIIVVNGHLQPQLKGLGTAYCLNANGPYNCVSVSGYFQMVTGAGNINIDIQCGASIGHSPCITVINVSTGWVSFPCDFTANRYFGGDLVANTGSGFPHVKGRTPDNTGRYCL